MRHCHNISVQHCSFQPAYGHTCLSAWMLLPTASYSVSISILQTSKVFWLYLSISQQVFQLDAFYHALVPKLLSVFSSPIDNNLTIQNFRQNGNRTLSVWQSESLETGPNISRLTSWIAKSISELLRPMESRCTDGRYEDASIGATKKLCELDSLLLRVPLLPSILVPSIISFSRVRFPSSCDLRYQNENITFIDSVQYISRGRTRIGHPDPNIT